MIQFILVDDVANVYGPVAAAKPGTLLFFLALIMFVSIALMNLVTAVIVEGAIEQAKLDREVNKAYKSAEAKKRMPIIREMFKKIDTDNSGDITLDEIVDVDEKTQEEMRKCFQMDDLVELFEIIDDDQSGTIKVDEFCDQLVHMVTTDTSMENLRVLRQLTLVRNEMSSMLTEIKEMKGTMVDTKDRVEELEESLDELRESWFTSPKMVVQDGLGGQCLVVDPYAAHDR
jgi:Ca2+-binding EF-hand superfamily protein